MCLLKGPKRLSTNVYRSNYRAKDTLGLSLIPVAAELDRSLPIYKNAKDCESMGISERDYSRVRLNAHWMIECTHV